MARLLRKRNIVISLVSLVVLLVIGAVLFNAHLFADSSDDDSKQALTAAETVLVRTAEQAGATDIEAVHRKDGGLRLYGKLQGHTFAVAIPANWNHQAALFANGYSPPGSPFLVHKDPMNKYLGPILSPPYKEGFAVGDISYDRSGLSFASSVTNTHMLKEFLDKMGTSQSYILGGSMGGNITMDLIGKYPRDFAGAMPLCGVVGSWPNEIGYIVDTRAAYNYFTRGTPYELPGAKDLEKNAVPTLSEGVFTPIGGLLQVLQFKRLVSPVFKLYAAATAHPDGPEAKIIDNILAVTGGDVAAKGDRFRDPASIAVPLLTVAYGMDNITDTFQGQIYDNTGKVYKSPHLSEQENAALNAGIQRVRATPEAARKAAEWTALLGQSQIKVLSIHNAIDPLVPNVINESQLREAMQRAGQGDNLVQREVPSMRQSLQPFSDMEGYAHCGFTPEQMSKGWDDLRAWVETNKKPQP
jgi:pimeloyl-ACP methyl ester carboxylesterase